MISGAKADFYQFVGGRPAGRPAGRHRHGRGEYGNCKKMRSCFFDLIGSVYSFCDKKHFEAISRRIGGVSDEFGRGFRGCA